MGLMDFFKNLFGGGASDDDSASGSVGASVNDDNDIEEDDDDDMDASANAEEEWRDIQQMIARFEANPLDMCGMDVNDPSSYWRMRNRFDEGMGEGREMAQCVMAAGFSDLDHWEAVDAYFNAKWAELGVNEDGEKEVKAKDEFINGALTSRMGQVADMQAQATAADPSLLAPVNGVTLEQWAKSAADIAALGQNGSPEQVTRILAQNGLDQATYDAAQAGWQQKMQGDTSFVIATEYGKYFTAAQNIDTNAGEPCSFEKYVELLAAQDAWSKQGRDIGAQFESTFGIRIVDFSNYGAYWSPKMATDVSMADQYDRLYTKYSAKYAGGDMDDDLAI